MDNYEKQQLITEIRNIYDKQITDLQHQIKSLTNFTDCLLEHTLKTSDDEENTKNELKNYLSQQASSRDIVYKYFSKRLG